MNSRKKSTYRPYSLTQTLLASVAISVCIAGIVYLFVPKEPMTAICVLIFVFLFMLFGAYSIKYEPFVIDSDQYDPRRDKLELTDYGLRFKNNELILGEFFYKDIKRIVPTETGLVILPLRPSVMQYWSISYDFLTKSNLNPDQIYAKIGNIVVPVANPSPSRISSASASASASSVTSGLSQTPVSDLNQPNNSLNTFRTILLWLLIGIILVTIYNNVNSHKKLPDKQNITTHQTQNT